MQEMVDEVISEVSDCDGVVHVESGDVTGVIRMKIRHGEYDALSSELLTTLGRYDGELYYDPNREFDRRFVLE